MAKEAFTSRKELLDKNTKVTVKKKIVKALVRTVALYECETRGYEKGGDIKTAGTGNVVMEKDGASQLK